MPTSPPISASEASARTGIPRRTLQWALAHGKLKAHKLSGRTGAWVIDPDDLDRYLENRDR